MISRDSADPSEGCDDSSKQTRTEAMVVAEARLLDDSSKEEVTNDEQAIHTAEEPEEKPEELAPELPEKKKRKDVSPAKYFEIAEETADDKTKSCTKYGCSRCGNIYKWKKSLNKHWKEKHDEDPGDKSYTPLGMTTLLEQGNHSQTEHRRCVHKDFLDRITVKGGCVASRGVSPARAPLILRPASPAAAQLLDKADEMDGDVPVKQTPNSGIPPGPSIIGTSSRSSLLDYPKRLLDQLNSPIVLNNQNRPAQALVETDKIEGSAKFLELWAQERQIQKQRRPSTSSSSSGSYCFSEVISPQMMSEVENEMEALNQLETAQGPDGRNVLKCPRCGAVLKTQTEYSQHISTHLASSFKHVTKCAVCRQHFPSGRARNDHFLLYHYDRLLSEKVLQQSQSVARRSQPTTSSSQIPQENALHCQLCDFKAKWPAELLKHRVSHSDVRPFACVVCGSTYKRKWDLVKHFRESHASLPSPYQQQSASTELASHRTSCSHDRELEERRVNGRQNEDENPVFQGDGAEKLTGAGDSSEKFKYKCTRCDFRGPEVSDVTHHMKTHSPAKRFGCPNCSYKSKWRSDVGKHLKRCGSGGDISSVLDYKYKHIDQMSSGATNKPSQSQSPRETAPTQPLQSRSSTSTAKNSQSFICDLCSYVTRVKIDFLKHKVICKESKRKRFLSPREPGLKKSKKLRSEFRCHQCSFTAADLRTYIDHRSEHTAERGQEPPRHSPTLNGEKIIDDARLKHPRKAVKFYKCSTCSFVCSKNTEFLVHQKRVHGIGKYKCSWCSERWQNKDLFLDHLITHSEFNPDEWESFLGNCEDVNNNSDSKETVMATKDTVNLPVRCSSLSPVPCPAPSGSYQLTCQWCCLPFRNIVTLFQHTRQVHPLELNKQCQEEGAISNFHTPNCVNRNESAIPESSSDGILSLASLINGGVMAATASRGSDAVSASSVDPLLVPGDPATSDTNGDNPEPLDLSTKKGLSDPSLDHSGTGVITTCTTSSEESIDWEQPHSDELRCWFCGEQQTSFAEVLCHMQTQHPVDFDQVHREAVLRLLRKVIKEVGTGSEQGR